MSSRILHRSAANARIGDSNDRPKRSPNFSRWRLFRSVTFLVVWVFRLFQIFFGFSAALNRWGCETVLFSWCKVVGSNPGAGKGYFSQNLNLSELLRPSCCGLCDFYVSCVNEADVPPHIQTMSFFRDKKIRHQYILISPGGVALVPEYQPCLPKYVH